MSTRAACAEGVLAVARAALRDLMLIFARSNLFLLGDETPPSSRVRVADSAWQKAMQ